MHCQSRSPLLDCTLLEEVLRQAVEGIVVCDAEGRLQLVNEEARRLAQSDPEGTTLDAIRERWGAIYEDGRLVPKDDYALARALRGESVVRREIRIVHQDGTSYDVVVSSAPIRDADRTIIAAVATLSDITELKQMEDALRKSEENFRRMFDESPLGAAMVSMDFRFLRVNAELCRITGYAEHELLALGFPDITHPGDLDRDVANARRLIAGEISQYKMEKRYIRKDGSLVWINLYVRMIRASSGEPLHFLPIMEDISERKQAEISLRLTERVVCQAKDAISVVGPDYRYRRVNPVYVARFGIPRDRLVGMHVADLMGWEVFRTLVKPRLDRCLAGEEVHYEWWFDTPKLGPRCLEVHYLPLRSESSEVEGVIVISSDITERKQAEKALQTARMEADRANMAKSRFLAAASHDLRQPLQAQILLHHLLEERNRDPALTGIIGRMGESLAAQQHLLTTLLDISRLDAGIVEVERSDLPVGPILDRLAREFAIQAETKGLRLRVVQCSAVVRTDPNLLERILRNLLSNAIRYTRRGRILLGCRRKGDVLKVQVWDTGTGIPEDQLTAIFEEFSQLGNPARDRSMGLGLGLAIVDRLARLLGYRINVRSALGRGSMFEIDTVPCISAPAAQRSAGREEPSGMAGETALIAVIDDDAQLLEALALALRMSGYEVVAGHSVEEAAAALHLRRRPPGVIVADYRLGHGRTGTDAIHQLRSAFGGAIPGILLTGDTSPDRLKEAKASGLRLLHKPVKAEDLTRAIEQARAGGG